MDLTAPGSDLLGPTRARVVLALHRATEPVSGREVARRAGDLPPSSALRELRALVQLGLVQSTQSTHATTFVLNRDHVLWAPVFEILASPAKVEERLGNLVSETLGPDTSCAIFGSVARGESTVESDIDILIVTDDSLESDAREDALDRVRDDLATFTGNDPQLIVVTQSQLRDMVQADDPLVGSWERDARTITGAEVRSLIREARA